MNYSEKIDFKKLNKAFVTNIQGKHATVECLCIPTSEFYKGKNGELYGSLEVVERKNGVGQYGDTHFIKQQLEKASYLELSEEQRKSIPIIGSFQPSRFGNVQTVVAEEVRPSQNQSQNKSAINPSDYVPF